MYNWTPAIKYQALVQPPKMSSSTHVSCPFCCHLTDNSSLYCSNPLCSCAKSKWNGYRIHLKNPTTGQIAELSEFGKFPKAQQMGFTDLGPVPAPPPQLQPAPVLVRTTIVTGYIPVATRYVLTNRIYY
jgi:hypothetical protein